MPKAQGRELRARLRSHQFSETCLREGSGYGAYNPAVLQRYLGIYRTYYNYCLVGKGKKILAMRLGLAKALQDPHTILHFS